jgi:uncharacterized protein (TIGR02145 family)
MVTNSEGCQSATSVATSVTVNPLPTAPIVGTITQPTCALAMGSVVLSSLPTGNWTINPGSIAGSGPSFTVVNLAADTYNFTVTSEAGCISPASANVVINPQPATPTTPLIGITTQPTCALATGSVVLSSLPAGNWTINPGSIAGSGPNFTVVNLAAGTYNFMVTSEAGCISPASANVVINPQPATPTAASSAATAVASETATLNGTVNANNTSTDVTFEYGPTPGYGSSITATPSPVTGTNNTAVSANIVGLTPYTTYHYRIVAVGAGCTTYGNDLIFTTQVDHPIGITGPATTVSSVSARLNGTVNANNASTTVSFVYGLSILSMDLNATAIPSPVTGNTNTTVIADLTGLVPGQTYYYYIKTESSGGAMLGETLTFSTPVQAMDGSGNLYNAIVIGTQTWMQENLKTTQYNDGSAIPNITDNATWDALTSPAYAWYDNNIANKVTYGALYNWYAVETGKLCPVGWHVPTDAQLTQLTNYVGGESVAGGKLKETGTTHWISPNEEATDEYGFTALPGGDRLLNGVFYSIGGIGSWWSSTDTLSIYAWHRFVWNNYIRFSRIYDSKTNGISVRCLKDNINPAIVTNVNDNGVGSLRYAIENANSTNGIKETITFNLPGTGPFTIQPLTPLPTITDPVVIDGYSQPGAIPATDSDPAKIQIEVDGTRVQWQSSGFNIKADNCVIMGLVINRFGESGIVINENFKGNKITGNYVGTDINGTVALGNGGSGLMLQMGSSENIIGGATSAKRNIISGNTGPGIFNHVSSRNYFLGNYIGVDVSGKLPLGNKSLGLYIAGGSDNTIGGANLNERNVISSNEGDGISFQNGADKSTMKGNFIGLDASGQYELGNLGNGVSIGSVSTNTIVGGTNPGERNIIAFNTGSGIYVDRVGTLNNSIIANSVYSNGGLGIDLGGTGVTPNDNGDADTGPNNLQNFPVLGNLSFSPGNVTVTGTLNSLPSLTYKLEFFANKVADNTGYGEGQTYLGSSSVTTNSAGNGTFTVTLPTMTKYGDVITATATDSAGNTSEFSQAIGGLQDQILSGTKIPFHYQVNGKGVKSISSLAVVNEVRSAFGNWTGITTSSMSFVYDNTPPPPQYASASDNINVVTFTDDKFPFSPGILAVTAKTLKIGANDAVAQIMDADIVFNPYFVNNSTYDFGIADNPSYHGFFDIQSVTTHEIGHILGLLHSGVYNATMWFEVGPGTIDRSLEQDDKSWLSYRYPNTNYNQTFGSISGNIKYGYNTDPVAGAIVLAVDPATSLAVVHAYSDADGNYLIPGLPPGSYRVYIMPLDGDVYGRDLRPGNISAYIYSNTFYTDYPGEFYNSPDLAEESNTTPTPVTVIAGQVATGIDFLTNKDVSKPTVVSVVPANTATGVSVLPNILITFSEPADMNSLTENSCYLTLSGSSAKIGGKYQPNGFEDRSDVVLFTLPENALSYESEYTLHITTAVTDLKNNPLGTEFTSIFHTGVHDGVAPIIKSTIPEKNATNVFLTQKIMVSFSEPMIKSSVESSFALTTGNGTAKVDCSPSWDEYMTLTLTPKSSLIEGKIYTISWTNAATDLSGNGLTAGSFSFTTIPSAPPEVIYMEPGGSNLIYTLGPGDQYLTTGIDVRTPIVVDFSEPINTATVNASTFKLLFGNSQVSGKFEFLNENSRVIFRPNADLTFGKTYTITLTGGIQDVSQTKQNFAGLTTVFTAATKPTKPHIDYNDPASNTGLTIEIGGNGFDPDPLKNKVTFATLTSSGVDALATTASLTSLTVKVPYGAVSGGIRVTSNGLLDDQDPNNLTTYIFIGSYPDPCNTATGNTNTGQKPRDGALDFNGANAYITNSGENTVSVITNLNTDDPVKNPPVELQPRIQVGTTPMKIDINPTGTKAYVTNFDSHTVSVIDLTNVNGKKNQVISTIKVGVNPFGVVATGDRVYVANYGSNNITVINVDPNSGGFDHAVANVNTGTHNRDCDISIDGGTLVVTGDNGLTLVRITKTALGFDYAVSNANPGSSTRDATITKDGGTAIVTTNDGGIFFVDITPGDNFGAAYGNTNPGSKAGDGKITFDGLFYYVTNPDDDKVTVYKISYEGSGSGSGTVSSSARISLKEYATIIPVGDSPEGIAMDPVNNKVVVVNSGSNNVTRVFICCPSEKTASDLIKDLVFDVQSMIYKGDIPKLRGYALIFTLNSSLRNINANRIKLAIADLKVFIGLVNTYIKNKQINTDRGNALIKAANAIIAKLQGTKSDTAETSLTDVGQSNLPDLISESKIGAIYPNPFSESITIEYEIADMELNSGKVMIQIYDVTGRVVCNLVNKNMEPGRYSVTWNGHYENEGSVSKGIYYIRFAAGKAQEVKRIMLVR